jgi:hypothetical protein
MQIIGFKHVATSRHVMMDVQSIIVSDRFSKEAAVQTPIKRNVISKLVIDHIFGKGTALQTPDLGHSRAILAPCLWLCQIPSWNSCVGSCK